MIVSLNIFVAILLLAESFYWDYIFPNNMQKEWVFLHSHSAEYEAGLQAFISYTVEVAAIDGDIKCPGKEYGNKHQLSPIVVQGHLQMFGMDDTYANGI